MGKPKSPGTKLILFYSYFYTKVGNKFLQGHSISTFLSVSFNTSTAAPLHLVVYFTITVPTYSCGLRSEIGSPELVIPTISRDHWDPMD